MKNLLKILSLAAPYKLKAGLNVLFNLLSIVFSLFSMTMLIPFLNLIFLKGESEYGSYFTTTPPPLNLSVDALVGNFNYQLTRIILSGDTLVEGKVKALIFLCAIIIILFLFKNVFSYLAMYVMADVRNGILMQLRNRTFAKLLSLPLSYYTEERKGDIISKMSNDVVEIEWSVLKSIELVFREPISIILFLATMIYMSPTLTIFVFIMLPVTGLLIGKVGNSLRKTSVEGQRMAGELISNIEETLTGLRIIKAFNSEDKMAEKFNRLNFDYFRLMVRMYRKRDLASPMSEFLGVTILVVILWFGGRIVLNEGMSASVFIAYIMLFSQIITPAKSFANAWYNIQRGAASADRIGEIMKAENHIVVKDDAPDPKTFNSSIVYDNVSFKYEEDFVLRNVSFEMQRGEMIALVGASGGGKSTIADLLPRFHDPVEGRITLDGRDLRDLDLKGLRHLMGMVTQQSILFNDTVFNNIAFGKHGATRQEVLDAARIANAHEFIEKLPKGYDTNIGDMGTKLSGGQKQRLSIARAVLKNPPLLILDEATSALDTESEKLVQEALFNLMKNRTSLVIAHRLSTIQSADKIIVMDAGRIAEQGTHTSLLAANGIYSKLCQLQSFD
ncbi:MAG: ABC transporter ATP-binding protein [Flavobacteriales bacterium]|nr:ABC transporter ATP-binding protein [Flavobacteriales bacterium]